MPLTVFSRDGTDTPGLKTTLRYGLQLGILTCVISCGGGASFVAPERAYASFTFRPHGQLPRPRYSWPGLPCAYISCLISPFPKPDAISQQCCSRASITLQMVSICGYALLCPPVALSPTFTSRWEFFTTLDYEFNIVRGRRPYRWTLWVRNGGRIFGAHLPSRSLWTYQQWRRFTPLHAWPPLLL
jgi:hypothetical protein